jgi:hypothetical protein
VIAGFGLSELGQAEVEDFGAAIFGDENIFRLQVAMDDSFFVRCGQSVRNLQRVVESLAYSNRAAAQTVPQSFSFEQFGDNVRRAFIRADVEDRQNVGMIQGRGGKGLLLEPAQAVGVQRKRLWQNLDGNFAFEAGVAGAVNLAHPARA